MEKRIDLQSPIFTIKPTVRFSQTMGVEEDFWSDMWYRYYHLHYSKLDLKEWFVFKTGKQISIKTIGRWIVRQQLYDDARIAVRSGAKQVSIEYFKIHGNRNIDCLDLVDTEDYFTTLNI